jgi:hypothetical protein
MGDPEYLNLQAFDYQEFKETIGGADGDRTRDLLTASSFQPLKTQDLRVFLQESPTYS